MEVFVAEKAKEWYPVIPFHRDLVMLWRMYVLFLFPAFFPASFRFFAEIRTVECREIIKRVFPRQIRLLLTLTLYLVWRKETVKGFLRSCLRRKKKEEKDRDKPVVWALEEGQKGLWQKRTSPKERRTSRKTSTAHFRYKGKPSLLKTSWVRAFDINSGHHQSG